MGLFGKLFEKKICDICGGEIGLLGNRKLEDGNMCKDCAALISPFLTERKKMSVEEMKEHLAYRMRNSEELAAFNPTRVMGNDMKVYLDEAKGCFIVSRMRNWREYNPDIISLQQVADCKVKVNESRRELKHPDQEGHQVPFNPPRFEFSYSFYATILVNSPWFSEIEFELTDTCPDSIHSPMYRDYERQANELETVLMSAHYAPVQPAQPVATAAPATNGSWTCTCGQVNNGKFCVACGKKKEDRPKTYRCDKCGWVPNDPANPPKFCPMCGDPITEADAQ